MDSFLKVSSPSSSSLILFCNSQGPEIIDTEWSQACHKPFSSQVLTSATSNCSPLACLSLFIMFSPKDKILVILQCPTTRVPKFQSTLCRPAFLCASTADKNCQAYLTLVTVVCLLSTKRPYVFKAQGMSTVSVVKQPSFYASHRVLERDRASAQSKHHRRLLLSSFRCIFSRGPK